MKLTIKRMESTMLLNVYYDGKWAGLLRLMGMPFTDEQRLELSAGKTITAEVVVKGEE